jgi:hypothetical protein
MIILTLLEGKKLPESGGRKLVARLNIRYLSLRWQEDDKLTYVGEFGTETNPL